MRPILILMPGRMPILKSDRPMVRPWPIKQMQKLMPEAALAKFRGEAHVEVSSLES